MFGRIRGLEIDERGNLYVLDGDAGTIRVFGRDGRHVLDIGRSGSGPGEFQNPTGIVLDPNETLWLFDAGHSRYTAFQLDGSLRGTYRREVAGGIGVRWDAVINDAGIIYEPTTIRTSTGDTRRVFLGLQLVEDVLVAVDTLFRPPPLPPKVFEVDPVAEGGVVVQGLFPIPLVPVLRDRMDPRGGYWLGTSDAFRFYHVSAGGDTTRVVERDGEPKPVTAADRHQVIQELADRFGSSIRLNERQIPTELPAWNGFFLDRDGWLWVERFRQPAATLAEPRLWDVYDSQGVYMGALNLPIDSSPTPALRSDRLVGVTLDQDGVARIVAFQVVKDSR